MSFGHSSPYIHAGANSGSPKISRPCSFVIAHRFSSPKSRDYLNEHVSVENAEWLSKVRERHTSPWSSLKHRTKMITPPSLLDSDGTGSSSPDHIPGGSSQKLGAVHGASANSTILTESRNGVVDLPHTTISASLASSGPVSTSEARFRPLISILQKRARKKEYQVSFSKLGTELKRWWTPTPYVKLTDYLMEAEEAGIVEIGSTEEVPWVQLLVDDSYPPEYFPLVDVMNNLLDHGQERPKRGDVALVLYRLYPGIVPNRGASQYISRAEEAGVVERRKKDRLELKYYLRHDYRGGP